MPSVRMVPLGPELRIYYNGAFLRSEVVRDRRNVGDVLKRRKPHGSGMCSGSSGLEMPTLIARHPSQSPLARGWVAK